MKNKILILSGVIMLFALMGVNMTGMQKVEAGEIQKNYEMFGNDEEIVPYADIIETKFRVVGGVTQYRRWNKTKGYWVDSEWIPVN